jgi:hypothetical protein
MVVTEAGIEFTVHVKHTEIKVRVLINIIVQGWNSQKFCKLLTVIIGIENPHIKCSVLLMLGSKFRFEFRSIN